MYQVVMLNDDYTPMEFVVYVIQQFFWPGSRDGDPNHAENPFGWARRVWCVFEGCGGY
jgi:hypothetical protein